MSEVHLNLRITPEQSAGIARRKRPHETLSAYLRRLIEYDIHAIEIAGTGECGTTELHIPGDVLDGRRFRLFVDGAEWAPKVDGGDTK
jgi:hypothetical protein